MTWTRVLAMCDLDLGDMTLGQDHDTPLGSGQQLCEISSIYVKEFRSYGPDNVDGQTDMVISIFPSNFVCRGIIKRY